MLILWTGSFFNKKDGHFYCKNTGIRRAKRLAKFKFLLKNKLCGFTPEWVSNRISKSPAWLNDLLRCKQLCAFSPEWVSKCLFKVPASVNDLLHCAQLCDFSPVWVIKCLVKCWDCLNDLLHCECVDLCGCFSHFGRTENGILGTRIKILRPLFNTN